MQSEGCTVLAHGATGRGNDQLRFERYTNVLAPSMKCYAAWRDPHLLEQFPGRKEMSAYLQTKGIEAAVGEAKRYSTDANIAGLSHRSRRPGEPRNPHDPSSTPQWGVWPQDAPDKVEAVTLRFEKGRPASNSTGSSSGNSTCSARQMTSLAETASASRMPSKTALSAPRAEGSTKPPGMELLGTGLAAVYQAVLDRRATALFRQMSTLVSDHIYDGRLFDPAPRAALAAIDVMAAHASGTVELGLYRGNLFFHKLTDVAASLYNPADASMEASDGLNPVSSQGYVEVQSAEALSMAGAGQIEAPAWEE